MAVIDEKSNITFLTNPCEARNPVVECIPYLPFSSNSFSETSETSDIMGTLSSEKVDKTVTVFTLLKVISEFPDRRCLQDLSLINLSGHTWLWSSTSFGGFGLDMKARAVKCIAAGGGHFEK